MASIRPCNRCGKRISIRQMPHEQWVAFDVSTDNPHKCFKKKTKDKNKKNNKLSAYHGINLEKEIEQNLEDNDLEYENFQTETDLKSPNFVLYLLERYLFDHFLNLSPCI